MPWIKKVYQLPNYVLVEKTFSTRFGKGYIYRDAHDKPSSEAQQKVNDRQIVKRMGLLANANFKEDDYFLTYTFSKDKRPKDLDECREIWRKYLRALRYRYKRRGKQFKYLWCIESENCAIHIHFLCNNEFNISEFPKWSYSSSPHIKLLDDRNYHSIGEYMAKEGHKKRKEQTVHTKKTMGTSRNLIRPEPKVTVLLNSNWSDTPRVGKGYTLDKSSLENGYIENPFTGAVFRHQIYRMMRKDE